MIYESVQAVMRAHHGLPATIRRPGSHNWIHGLPFKLRFKRSKIYVSTIPVWVIGFVIGFIGAIMGIGGAFILVPMLIYFLRVPTATVIGTSMVLTLITMASATVMHAATNHLVDAVLALILMAGGVVGAQFGARTGQKMRGERLASFARPPGFRGWASFRRRVGGAARRPFLDTACQVRMMQRTGIILALALLICGASPAAAERLVVSLSNHRVAITSNFVGEDLVLFGTIEPDAANPKLRRGLRSGRHRDRAAADLPHPAQAARARHLGQRRLARIRARAVLSRHSEQSPGGRNRQSRHIAAAAGRARQFPAAATHRPGHRRHRARRSVPRRLRAAGKRARPLPRIVRAR